jgi:hypothetical protein
MRISTIALMAGLCPVIAVNAAFLINLNQGLEACFPYIEGCYSVSRAVRSGPGLSLFKILAFPAAMMMAWYWIRGSRWFELESEIPDFPPAWVTAMGVAGAGFFLVYALSLGTDGELYRWMRRYGVVFFFAMTSLAQLFLTSKLWRWRDELAGGALKGKITLHFLVVLLMWGLGIASAFKRKLIDDPEFLDRVENALEWDFALALSLTFVAISLFHRSAEQLKLKAGY